MKRSRRDFMKTAALAGAGIALTSCGGGSGSSFTGPTPPTPPGGTGGGGPISNLIVNEPFQQSPLLRKFISPLPGLGGSGIPVATPDTLVYPYADFYSLAAVQFEQQMHPDLPGPTRLWGYRNQANSTVGYLGPLIVARRNRPVILNMANMLPARHILPVDTSLMGADGAQNRIAVHLHGGFVPWTSDGVPYSWYTPKGVVGARDGSAGSTFLNGIQGLPGSAQYYYPNQQSSRLMWYHDHAMGITRLNAYAGLAAGYLLNDDVMNALTSGSPPVIPPLQYTIPLILQDKSFRTVTTDAGRAGDLWYPSRYEANQDGPSGRWDEGPVSDGFTSSGKPKAPSCVPEFFADTPVINGQAYPVLQVEPRRYRFLLLNGSQARFYNLNLFYESNVNGGEPNFSKAGPAFIQIGTEGGLLPEAVVLNSPPTLMPQASDGSVDPDGPKNLVLAPAERADLIIDFSACQPGDQLILYNDAPAPFPCGEERNDYFTGCPDNTTLGGAASTQPGKGPNTRTMMRIKVVGLSGAPDPMNFTRTLNALTTQLPQAYRDSHIPFGEYDLDPEDDGVIFKNKTLCEDFDGYGRLIQRVGADSKLYADSYARNYDDTPTEIAHRGETQVWDIYNLTGDTHPIHFHIVNVQVIGRADFDASDPTNVDFHATSEFRPPDANERGWKETVRMNPGTVTRVIMKFDLPSVPFTVPNSPRLQSEYGITGAEYVWHCHILEHEEHDMMRPLVVK